MKNRFLKILVRIVGYSTFFIVSAANAELWIGPKLGFPGGAGAEVEVTFDKVGGRSGVGVVPIKGLNYSIPMFVDYYFYSESDCDGTRVSLGGIFDDFTHKKAKKIWKFSPVASIGYGKTDNKFERIRYNVDLGIMQYGRHLTVFASSGVSVQF